ncbi:MAG: hypothetical protein IPQ24_02695 [Anaeromyxobacter sp.]|nr:hypothetical protein [Anaeromyxobacter sp.]
MARPGWRALLATTSVVALATGLVAALAWPRAPGTRPAAPDRWLAVAPVPEGEADGAALDLRGLNEAAAGDHGFIGARGRHFVQLGTGRPIRFWGVNGPPRGLSGEALRRCARLLARHGVNLVRIHAGYFDGQGEVVAAEVDHALEVVEALKAEGIYTHLSTWYPLWFTPAPGTAWLEGYDGSQYPFAALMFNPGFQERYRAWWRALLLTPSPRTGRRLVDEPAVAGVEIQNEDSLLFPTVQSLPEPQLVRLEGLFARWLAGRHGSLAAAQRAWAAPPLPRDAPASGRMALRPLWQIAQERTSRDQDTARFLVETESSFYAETYAFLRALGFRGLIGTSNWRAADERVLGPLERLASAGGDFVDRHGYFGTARQGEGPSWSLRAGQTYLDRSALRLDGERAEGGRSFENPVMDPLDAGKPSMLSEVSWERPGRFRAEASPFLAAYGALQGSGALVQYDLEAEPWASRVRGHATPWPLTSPGQLGQFPAAALLFRQGLVATGEVVARVSLGREALARLEGTPLPHGEALREGEHDLAIRAGPVPPGRRLDPLLHLVGRVEVAFTDGPTEAVAQPGSGSVDPVRRLVRSATGELTLDYQAGLLVLDAPGAQGAVGALRARPVVETEALRITSTLETGTVLVVALDGAPLVRSRRMLLQVMSEEQASGFRSEPAGSGRRRLLDPGGDPWQVRAITGSVAFTRPDAASLGVTALDLSGRRVRRLGDARRIDLLPSTFHYLIEPGPPAPAPAAP